MELLRHGKYEHIAMPSIVNTSTLNMLRMIQFKNGAFLGIIQKEGIFNKYFISIKYILFYKGKYM